MTIQAQLPGGMTLEFPDGTPDAIVQGAVKQHLSQQPSAASQTPESKLGLTPAPSPETKPPPDDTTSPEGVPVAVGDTVVSPDDMARVNAPPANPPLSLPTKDDVTKFLAPAPNTTYGDILPLAKDNTTGAIRLALPNVIRNPLLGLTEGPGTSGTFGSSGVTWNPETGTYGLTPEAASVGQFAATPLRFSGSVPANQFMPPGILERKPLPADATALSPDAAARVRAAQGGTVPVAQPTVSTPFNTPPPEAASSPVSGPNRQYVDPTKPFTYNPPSTGWPAGTESWAAPPPTSLPTGVPVNQMAPTVAADGSLTPPPQQGPPVPTTSDGARAIAKAYYDRFDKAAQDGGSLNPQATDRFIASVEAAAPPPGIGQAVAGKNAITDLVERLQDYKGQPMSLQDAHVVDQQLGNLISAEYGKTGVSSIGRQLQDIQQQFRDQLSNPAPGDVVSGQAGLDALAPARKAYSQAMKLDTIERIQERADMTDNPTTSFRTQIRTLLTNDRLSRGFSDEEKAALQDAANRGVAGSALHLMGSRLIPIITGSAGGGITGAALGYGLNEAARAGANALAARRLQNAYTILGKSVPPNISGP